MMFQKFARNRRARLRRFILGAAALATAGAAQAAETQRALRETNLFSFQDWTHGIPSTGLVVNSRSELFDMFLQGLTHNIGVRLTPSADRNRWTATVLNSGTGPFFYNSDSDVVLGAHDIIYGFGLKWRYGFRGSGCGFVYEFLPPPVGQATRAPKTIYEFQPALNGCEPGFGLAGDASGVLFGVKRNSVNHATSVFRLEPPADGQSQWRETDLYSFPLGSNRLQATSRVILGQDGALYGTASIAPAYGDVVYRLTPPPAGSTQWIRRDIYRFTGGNDALQLNGGLVVGPDGALYGVGALGGRFNRGAVFRLSPPAEGKTPWTETILYSFKGVKDGNYPFGRPLFDKEGALYGLASDCNDWGSVFKLTPPQAGAAQWTQTVLHHFQGTDSDGGHPSVLTIDAKGVLYGIVQFGGGFPDNDGFVFKLE